jgi:hypothetical protein
MHFSTNPKYVLAIPTTFSQSQLCCSIRLSCFTCRVRSELRPSLAARHPVINPVARKLPSSTSNTDSRCDDFSTNPSVEQGRELVDITPLERTSSFQRRSGRTARCRAPNPSSAPLGGRVSSIRPATSTSHCLSGLLPVRSSTERPPVSDAPRGPSSFNPKPSPSPSMVLCKQSTNKISISRPSTHVTGNLPGPAPAPKQRFHPAGRPGQEERLRNLQDSDAPRHRFALLLGQMGRLT